MDRPPSRRPLLIAGALAILLVALIFLVRSFVDPASPVNVEPAGRVAQP